jgi:hypothetical protein
VKRGLSSRPSLSFGSSAVYQAIVQLRCPTRLLYASTGYIRRIRQTYYVQVRVPHHALARRDMKGVAFPFLSRCGLQQGLECFRFFQVRFEPRIVRLRSDDNRHPHVNLSNYRIGSRGDDGAGIDNVLFPLPPAPEPRHIEGLPVLTAEVVWGLRFSPVAFGS